MESGTTGYMSKSVWPSSNDSTRVHSVVVLIVSCYHYNFSYTWKAFKQSIVSKLTCFVISCTPKVFNWKGLYQAFVLYYFLIFYPIFRRASFWLC